jgi:alpha-L-rhamnosidase
MISLSSYLVLAVVLIVTNGLAAACVVGGLTCEYLEDPQSVGTARPRLSWILASDRRGSRQTAHQVLVAENVEELGRGRGSLWDSGKVASAQSVLVEYRGVPLKSRMRCYWKVRVWDETGEASDWSAAASWAMGLLTMKDWTAKWIGFDDVPASKVGKKVYRASPYLRKDFVVTRGVHRAVVYATALGIYELYINGRRVGDEYFTPGYTEYAKRLHHNAYDVTDLVQNGENAIGGILADGWYAGNISNLGQRRYGTNLRLKVQLHVEYDNGQRRTLESGLRADP